MGPKKMLIALGIGFVAVVALAIFVLVIEPGTPSTEERLKERGLVFRYKDPQNRTIPDVATKLEVQRGEDTVVLEKASGRTWRLKKPVDARADRSKVLSILTDLKNLRVESVVAPEAGKELDPEKFGLKEPRIRAAFWIGEERHELAIGSEVKGARDYEKKAYVRADDTETIYVVDNPLVEKLDKEPDDFRDKNVFERTRDPERATALRVITEGRTLAFAKAKKEWELSSPVADLADKSKVEGLLSKCRNLEAEAYVSEDDAKLADYGLDKPQLTCELKADDGAALTLLVGSPNKDDDKQLYAKRGEEPSIFTIKKDFLDDINVKLDDVREKKVAAGLDEDDATRLELTRGEATWAVARKDKDDDWRLVQPKDAKAEGTAVDDFLRDLKRLRVARWVDDPEDEAHKLLEKPEAVITLLREPEGKRDEKPPIKLSLSAPVKTEEEEGRYVQREGQKTLLFVSSKKPEDSASYEIKDSVESIGDIVESLDKGYLDLFDRTVFDFSDSDVTHLVIQRGALKLVCEKEGEDWKLAQPVKLDADKSNVNRILAAMNDLKADQYVAESPEDLKPYGLDKPALTLTATITEEVKDEPKGEDEAKDDEKKDDEDEKGEGKEEPKKEPEKRTYTKTLLVGRKIDGTTHGMEEGGSLVFKIRSWDVSDLSTEPISTTIADFTDTDATSLTIAHRGKPEIVLEKKDDTWKLAKPKDAEADQDAVKNAIDALHDLKARRFLDYEAKDDELKAYGLDPAEVVVTVQIKDKEDFVLHLGKPVPDETDEPGAYARKRDSKQVFLMAKTKVDDVAKELRDFEKKPEPKEGEKKEEGKEEEGKEEAKKPGDEPEAGEKPKEK